MPCPAEAQLEKPEPELIVDARNGDLDAMTELFRRHYSHSVTVARRMLPARRNSWTLFSRRTFLRSGNSNPSAERQVSRPGSHELS